MKCEACDIEFENGSKWHPNRKYCSRKCCSIAGHRKRRNLSIKNLNLICCVCNTKFTQKRANNTEYCSRECKKLGVSRKSRGLCVRGSKKHVKGTGYITTSGYKIISMKHANATKRGQIMEHVFIMSNELGRPINKKETVHHKNGIRSDNRIENLELWSSSHPPGQRVEYKIQWCKEFLKQYDYEVIKQGV